ncbi:ferritin-like domain-containing protein, partial [Streptomyces sp. SID4985]|uniref:sulfurtransferase TusA family protein n=1 Tax=Streptomyces sp. SID4985 TaxID=2690292 RepID=UPI00136E15BC
MTTNAASADLGTLGFEQGARLLLTRVLRQVPPGTTVEITGTDPALALHLAAWCRHEGHELERADPRDAPVVARLRPGP